MGVKRHMTCWANLSFRVLPGCGIYAGIMLTAGRGSAAAGTASFDTAAAAGAADTEADAAGR